MTPQRGYLTLSDLGVPTPGLGRSMFQDLVDKAFRRDKYEANKDKDRAKAQAAQQQAEAVRAELPAVRSDATRYLVVGAAVAVGLVVVAELFRGRS